MEQGEHAEQVKQGRGRSILSLLIMVVIVVAFTVGLRMFVFVPYEIPSGSMEETIMTGDMVFSEKISYYTRKPAAGDIVTFNDPEVPNRTLIKRVVATAGQTVDMADGKVIIDGQVMNEPYTNGKPSYPLQRTAAGVTVSYPYVVPNGCIWVMGDNRTSSQDSRYFGAVPISSVTGRGAFIYWPLSHFGMLS